MDPNAQSTQSDQLNNYREQYSHYARQLLSDLGLGGLGQPERSQLLAAIEVYVQQVMANTLLENVDREQLDEAERILDRGGDMDQVIVHLLVNTPDIEVKMAQAMTETYARMVHECRELANAITKAQPNQDQNQNQNNEPAPTTNQAES